MCKSEKQRQVAYLNMVVSGHRSGGLYSITELTETSEEILSRRKGYGWFSGSVIF